MRCRGTGSGQQRSTRPIDEVQRQYNQEISRPAPDSTQTWLPRVRDLKLTCLSSFSSWQPDFRCPARRVGRVIMPCCGPSPLDGSPGLGHGVPAAACESRCRYVCRKRGELLRRGVGHRDSARATRSNGAFDYRDVTTCPGVHRTVMLCPFCVGSGWRGWRIGIQGVHTR